VWNRVGIVAIATPQGHCPVASGRLGVRDPESGGKRSRGGQGPPPSLLSSLPAFPASSWLCRPPPSQSGGPTPLAPLAKIHTTDGVVCAVGWSLPAEGAAGDGDDAALWRLGAAGSQSNFFAGEGSWGEPKNIGRKKCFRNYPTFCDGPPGPQGMEAPSPRE